MDLNILSWIIWLPIIGIIAIFLIPRDKGNIVKIVAAVATGLQLWMVIVLWVQFDSSYVGFSSRRR